MSRVCYFILVFVYTLTIQFGSAEHKYEIKSAVVWYTVSGGVYGEPIVHDEKYKGALIRTPLLIRSKKHIEPITCGKRKINAPAGQNDSYHGQFPWHAAIYHIGVNQKLELSCGGTLIGQRFVLTAAECILDNASNILPARYVFLRLGAHHLNALNLTTEKFRKVNTIHQPESDEQDFKSKIIILEMEKDVIFDDYIQPACIDRKKSAGIPWLMLPGWRENSKHVTKLIGIEQDVGCTLVVDGWYTSCICEWQDGREKDIGGGLVFESSGSWFLRGAAATLPVNFTSTECWRMNVAKNFIQWIYKITKIPYLKSTVYKPASEVDPTRKYTSLLPRHCGNFVSKDILEGDRTKPLETPWMAIIGDRDIELDAIALKCVGTLISKRYVLTSCKCIESDYLVIRLGMITLENTEELDLHDYEVDYVICHPNANRTGGFYSNDAVALIRLAKDVTFEDHIQPTCLAGAPNVPQFEPAQYLVMGWTLNITNLGFISPTLRKDTIKGLNLTECDEKFKRYELDSNAYICSTAIDMSPLFLTKRIPIGHPIQHENAVRFVQFGIYHFSESIMKISYYIDWIIANMEQ